MQPTAYVDVTWAIMCCPVELGAWETVAEKPKPNQTQNKKQKQPKP